MAEETAAPTETAPAPNGETKSGEPPQPGPIPGTKQFEEDIAAGKAVHAPDPTGPSPGIAQEEERQKNENDQSKK